jgi:hypothetical protein
MMLPPQQAKQARSYTGCRRPQSRHPFRLLPVQQRSDILGLEPVDHLIDLAEQRHGKHARPGHRRIDDAVAAHDTCFLVLTWRLAAPRVGERRRA